MVRATYLLAGCQLLVTGFSLPIQQADTVPCYPEQSFEPNTPTQLALNEVELVDPEKDVDQSPPNEGHYWLETTAKCWVPIPAPPDSPAEEHLDEKARRRLPGLGRLIRFLANNEDKTPIEKLDDEIAERIEKMREKIKDDKWFDPN